MRVALIVSVCLCFAGAAAASRMPTHWHAPPWWLRQAICIHSKEGAWNANTGNSYYGGMQFLLSTWRSVGGPSYPHLVSPREQLYRAWLVWRRDGGSWREWGTARACGLR
jgi:hypothetical protein